LKTTFKNIAIKISAYLFIGMMGMFIANRAFFMHSHKLSNGVVVAHAHPYHNSNDATPFKSHQHTNAELLFFQNVNIFLPIVFFIFALVLFTNKVEYLTLMEKRYLLDRTFHFQGRAPPIS